MRWGSAIAAAVVLLMVPASGAGDNASGVVDNDILFAENNAVDSGQFTKNLSEGRAALLAKDYKAALASFLDADREKFVESPNYELLPVISWLQFKLGQKQAAHQTQLQAKEVLNVLIGKDKCVEDARGWTLEPSGPVNAAVLKSVEARMCSVFLEDYLTSNDSKQRSAFTTFAGRLYVIAESFGA